MATVIDCEPDELRAALRNLIADLGELNAVIVDSSPLDAVVAFAQVVQQLSGLIDLLDGDGRDG